MRRWIKFPEPHLGTPVNPDLKYLYCRWSSCNITHIHNGVEIFVAGSTDSAIVLGDVQRSSYSTYSPLPSHLRLEKIFTWDPAMSRTSVNTVNGHGDDLPIRNLSQYRADIRFLCIRNISIW